MTDARYLRQAMRHLDFQYRLRIGALGLAPSGNHRRYGNIRDVFLSRNEAVALFRYIKSFRENNPVKSAQEKQMPKIISSFTAKEIIEYIEDEEFGKFPRGARLDIQFPPDVIDINEFGEFVNISRLKSDEALRAQIRFVIVVPDAKSSGT